MINKKQPVAELGKYEKNIGAGGTYRLRKRPVKEPRSTPVADSRPLSVVEASRRAAKPDYWETLLL